MTNLQLNNKYSLNKTADMATIPNLNFNNSNDMATSPDLCLNNFTRPTTISDTELNNKIKSLVKAERKLTQNILNHIAEVDKRRLYLKMAYSSLFEYLTKEIGYSAGAAQRRIDAARLIQQIPEVLVKIESGSINLSQISKVQRVFRELKKNNPLMMSAKQEVLKKLENQNNTQTDLILAREFNLKIKANESRHIQKDESVRVELTFLKEEMELIRQAQSLLSYKTGGTLKSTLLEMARQVIKKSTPATVTKKQNVATAKVEVTRTGTSAKIGATKQQTEPKSITPKLRKEILTRDGGCQFKDHTTGKICGSKYFLEIDHIQPKFAQGSNQTTNLRVLCKNHNIFRYKNDY